MISAHEAMSRARSSRRKSRGELERDARRLREQLAYADDIQCDYEKWQCGVALPYTGPVCFPQGVSPLTLPGNDALQSWHKSNAGVTMAPQLIQSNALAPGVLWDADVTYQAAFRMDTLTTGIRGVATYGLTIDGGLSYFQTGTTAFTVPVPLFGRTLQMATGTFTTGDQYVGVCKSLANLTPKTRTLLGAATDSSKPLIVPRVQNGLASINSVGGTSGGMVDSTSPWASDVTSTVATTGLSQFLVMAGDSITPSAIRTFFCYGCKTPAVNPTYFFSTRNGTNNYRSGHVDNSAVATNRDAGSLDLAFHVYSLVVNPAGNLSVWVDGANIVNNLSWGTGATTCDAVALFCLFRNSAQTNNNLHRFLAETSYSRALTTAERQSNEAYFKGVYATP